MNNLMRYIHFYVKPTNQKDLSFFTSFVLYTFLFSIKNVSEKKSDIIGIIAKKILFNKKKIG